VDFSSKKVISIHSELGIATATSQLKVKVNGNLKWKMQHLKG